VADHPHLLHTVLDTTRPRELAEFWRELLGLRYRDGDAPSAEGRDEPDWLVLTGDDGTRRLAFQLVDDLPRPTWPEPGVAQQLHLDLTVPDVGALERQRERALRLGAEQVLDRSDDEDEPLHVFTDPSGHPFCIFVA
jgi:hypothetical protein